MNAHIQKFCLRLSDTMRDEQMKKIKQDGENAV